MLEDAFAALHHTASAHYEHKGEGFARAGLGELFDMVVATVASRELAPLSARAEDIATERCGGGFDLSGVRAAFNAIELAMWRLVVTATPPEELAESIGLSSPVDRRLVLSPPRLVRRHQFGARHRTECEHNAPVSLVR